MGNLGQQGINIMAKLLSPENCTNTGVSRGLVLLLSVVVVSLALLDPAHRLPRKIRLAALWGRVLRMRREK
jgi:hypothetical protein